MISFQEATDDEMIVMREAVDALALVNPKYIYEDETCSDLVHAVLNEVHARRNMRLLSVT